MSTDPLVTVYIPCRNYGRFLRQCVESVFQQLYSNWELVIVDECSDDDTIEVAEGLCRRFPSKAKLLRNSKPVGLQRLANSILGIANGKYMIRLDADDWLDESALLVMVAKLESLPNSGLVYGNYFYTDSNGKVLGIERQHKLASEGSGRYLPPHGACTMFRTRSLRAVGGYSEDVKAQDGWELWYKLLNRINPTNLDVPIFYYRQHDGSLSRDQNRLLNARSRIFERLSNSLSGDYNLKNVAVIPVKESYPGFESVPFQKFGDSSLLERAINTAAKSSKVSSVVVSSSSQRVLDYAKELEFSGTVPTHFRVLRSAEVETRNIPIRDLMTHAGEYFFSQSGEYPDAVAFLSLHAVYRSESHINEAFNVLRVTESDTVVSVKEERDPMFVYGETGLELVNPGRFDDLTYDRERLYRFNGSIIASWWDVLKQHHLFGEKIAFVEMSAEDSMQITKSSLLKVAPEKTL